MHRGTNATLDFVDFGPEIFGLWEVRILPGVFVLVVRLLLVGPDPHSLRKEVLQYFPPSLPVFPIPG